MRLFILCVLVTISSFRISGQITINEFLSSNLTGITDEDNDYSDWIELYNISSTPFNLSGFQINDDDIVSENWIFPEIVLPPHGFILVFASGKDKNGPLLTLQTIIDKGDNWQYIIPTVDLGTGWRNPGFDDSGWLTGPSGFGYGDGDDATIIDPAISVFIRKEFIVANHEDVVNLYLHIDYDDGFVAYLNGEEIGRSNLGAIGQNITFNNSTGGLLHEATMYSGGGPEIFSLSGAGNYLIEGTNVISIQVHNSDIGSSDLSLIPIVTLERSGTGYSEYISPFISMTSGKYLHTNFKLDSDSEKLYLYSSSGELLQTTAQVSLADDISYGRQPDGDSDWFYFGEPTPGEPNSTYAFEEPDFDSVVFSPPGGKHSGSVIVSLSSAFSTDSIYYTLNGSVPDRNDIRYTGTINISENSVIRARIIDCTALPSKTGTNTYITETDHEFPIVCLSTDPISLWDWETGLFVLGPYAQTEVPYYGANFWQDWEKPLHIEFYDQSGIKKIDQGAGVKVFGGWSRANEQKSVALFARKDYGKGSFDYKFFNDKPIDKFESLVLRNSGNDYYGIRFHDAFITKMASEMNIDRQAFQPAAIYLNGEYWGLLNIREKVSEHFLAGNHLVNPDDVNLLDLNGEIIHGNNTGYQNLLDYLNVNTSLQNSEKYQWMADKIDVDNYIKYQLTQIYIDNKDWPGNNIKFWNTNKAGSKWKWILFDTDYGYAIYNNDAHTFNTLAFALEPDKTDWPNPAWSTLLFRRMVTNLDFRNDFINQYADRLNTTFLYSNVSARIDSLKEVYDTEIQYHHARWGGTHDSWLYEIERRKTFGKERPEYARNHIRQVFGLESNLTINIEVSDENSGKVKINSVYPDSYPFNGIYFKNVPIKLTAMPLPGYKFVRWEGSINSTDRSIKYDMPSDGSFKAIFEQASISDIHLVINEINYKSSEENNTEDWIEIMNNGPSTVDMEDWIISDLDPGSGYLFPGGVILAPNEYLIICRDLNNFREIYPEITNSVGDLPFGLSTDGEYIILYNRDGLIIDEIYFEVYTPWPENNFGTGATIELIDPDYDNALGENWKSGDILGSPGKPNKYYVTSIPDIITNNETFSDFECFPNPFSDFTTIQFQTLTNDYYRLEVYDMKGQLISILSEGYLTANTYYIDWTGNAIDGSQLPGGIYNIRLSNSKQIKNIKVIIINGRD